MNRIEFLKELEDLLQGISVEERQDALAFYQNYFDDAGYENEAEVIRELGSPEKVAAIILTDTKTADDNAQFTESGFQDAQFDDEKNTPVTRGAARGSYTEGGAGAEQGRPWTNKWLKIILIVLVVIAACTIGGPIAIGVLAALFGLICAAFGIFLALVVGSIALCIAGVAIVIVGLTKLFVAFPVTLLLGGIGTLLFVVGLICTVGCIKLCVIVVPAMVRGIVYVCKLPFRNRERRAL